VAPLIETQNLTKHFDSITAVQGITLNIAEGEIVALLGPNGAGKTTTVRMLSSILKPTAGSASVAGFDVVRNAKEIRHLVGHLTEFPGLYLRMRALEYLEFFGELQGMGRAERRQRATELLEQFGLGDAHNRRLGEFSKGMRQKVALVRAMLHNPRVLFLDEPTSAMDPHSAKQVRDAINNLRGSGRTIILCTHNLYEAETLADRIAMIRRGRLIANGTVEQLKRELLGLPLWQVQLANPLGMPWPYLDGHLTIEAQDDLGMRYRASAPEIANPLLLRALHDAGANVLQLSQVPQSLEQVYLKLMEDQVANPRLQVASEKS
jgi:ABC-2 type transport system ATP-binding protein